MLSTKKKKKKRSICSKHYIRILFVKQSWLLQLMQVQNKLTNQVSRYIEVGALQILM